MGPPADDTPIERTPSGTVRRLADAGWVRWPVTLLLLPVLGLALAIGGELVSDTAVASSLVDAVESGQIRAQDRTTGWLDNTVDHHSECIGLTTGLGDAGRGVVEVAISSPNLGRCSVAIGHLEAWAAGGPLTRDWDYLRYWHGHTAITRPVLAIAGIEAVRIVVLALLIASVLAFVAAFRRLVGTWAALLFVAPVVVATDLLVTPWGGPHGLAAVAVFVGGTLLVRGLEDDRSLAATAVYASLAAGLVVLVDVFTMGTLSWVMTTFLVGVAWWASGSRGWSLLRPMGVGAGAWAIGYVTTWVAKWALAGTVVGFGEVFDRISRQVAARTVGEVDYIELGLGRTTATVLGSWLQGWLGRGITVLVVVWMVAAFLRARTTGSVRTWVALCSPVLLAVLWFEVMQNHTQVHRWFTANRGVAICAAVLLVASEVVRRGEPAEVPEPLSSGSGS